jgi:hypothetical protein
MSTLLRPRSTTANVGAVAYTAGDEISNSATAGSVVRATFSLDGFSQGLIYAAQLDLTAASGNVVTTASDLELLIFHTVDAPAAVGDNVTHPISAAVRALAIAAFRFDDEGWTGPLGTVAAGTSQLQAVGAHLVQPLATNVLQSPWGAGLPFTFQGKLLSAAGRQFTAVLRALAAWTPANVVNTIGISLDIEAT